MKTIRSIFQFEKENVRDELDFDLYENQNDDECRGKCDVDEGRYSFLLHVPKMIEWVYHQ